MIFEHNLKPFENFQSQLDLKISFTFNNSILQFNFLLSGVDVSRLKLPSVQEKKERKDGLWQTTAFELFIGEKDSSRYIELNLAPTGDWNVYEFTSERQGMKPSAVGLKTPFVEASLGKDSYKISGTLDLQALELKKPLEVSATAVLEFSDNHKEYWAIQHSGEKPDFHKRASFVVSL
ncbi:MAG: DOMON-like domain-containing protein [Bdellovibrionota bacterium]